MYTFFLICFGVGVGLTVVCFILGGVFDLFDMDMDVDFDLFDVSICIPSPMLLLLFVTAFGGSGALLCRLLYFLPAFLVVLIAISIGMGFSVFLNTILIKPLKKAQNTSIPDEKELIGLLANVSETIKEGNFGEITYVIHGNTFSSPAKAVNGELIPKGTAVAICKVKNYVYYVACLNEGGKEE